MGSFRSDEWKIAYRRYLRAKRLCAQNEVAMQFFNECQNIIESFGITIETLQLVPNSFSKIAFHLGDRYVEFYTYLADFDVKWRLSSFGTAFADGQEYDTFDFDEKMRALIRQYGMPSPKTEEGSETEDERDSYYDAPEVYNMSPYGPIRER